MKFELGKAQTFSEGTDISIFACGHLVWKAIEASKILSRKKSISVELINIHTIKPLDTEAIQRSISKTRCAVTAEEHNIIGGLRRRHRPVQPPKFPHSYEICRYKRHFRGERHAYPTFDEIWAGHARYRRGGGKSIGKKK